VVVVVVLLLLLLLVKILLLPEEKGAFQSKARAGKRAKHEARPSSISVSLFILSSEGWISEFPVYSSEAAGVYLLDETPFPARKKAETSSRCSACGDPSWFIQRSRSSVQR